MPKNFKANITENIPLNEHFRLLNLSPLSDIIVPEPGQFYMLRTGDTYDPLLKRPFSIFRHEDNTLKFLYRIRGKGTLSLSNLKSGDIIDVIGPLGNSYSAPEGDFIAIAGGIGIASLLPLLRRFKKRAYLFYGARNKDELIMLNEARSLSKEIFITTDDGSEGEKGLITDSLSDFLNPSQIPPFPPLLKGGEGGLPIYACGPTPMLKELSKVVAEYPSSLLPLNKGRMGGVKCYVSLEEHMACGVGACLGCVVKTVSGYKRVCKEGPVFDIEEIVWE